MSEEDKSTNEETAHEKSENLERYSFTLDSDIIDRIDKISQSLEEKKKWNRSMIVREALSKWISDNTEELGTGPGIGISSYIYNHHDNRVVSDIMNIQHDKDEIISSTTHIHLDHKKCFEIVILKGDLDELKRLNDSMRSIKGITFFTTQLHPYEK